MKDSFQLCSVFVHTIPDSFSCRQVLFNISHQVLHQLPRYANVRPFDTEAWDEPNKREQDNLLTGISFVASELDV